MISEPKTIQMISSIFALIGSGILAYSLNRLLSEIKLSIGFISVSIESFVHSKDVLVFDGLTERIERAEKGAGTLVRIGIYFIVASTILAAISIYL